MRRVTDREFSFPQPVHHSRAREEQNCAARQGPRRQSIVEKTCQLRPSSFFLQPLRIWAAQEIQLSPTCFLAHERSRTPSQSAELPLKQKRQLGRRRYRPGKEDQGEQSHLQAGCGTCY